MAHSKKKEGRLPIPDEYDRVVDEQSPGHVACIKYCTNKPNLWKEALQSYADELSTGGVIHSFFTPGFKNGTQLKITKGKWCGISVNVYNTGTITLQGKSSVQWDKDQFPHLRDLANKDTKKAGNEKDGREMRKNKEKDEDPDSIEPKKRKVDTTKVDQDSKKGLEKVEERAKSEERTDLQKSLKETIESRIKTPPRATRVTSDNSCLSEAADIEMMSPSKGAEKTTDPPTPVSETLASPSHLLTPADRSEVTNELEKTRIPVLNGSPQVGKIISAADGKAILAAIGRLEQSHVNNMRELNLISEDVSNIKNDVSSIKSSVQDIARRVTEIEGSLKKPQQEPDFGNINHKLKESIGDIKPMLEENSRPLFEAIDDVQKDVKEVDTKVSKVQTSVRQLQGKPNMTEISQAVKESIETGMKQLYVKPDMNEITQLMKDSIDEIESKLVENTRPLQESINDVRRNIVNKPNRENPQNEDAYNYYCKGEEDILSNLHRTEVMYEGAKYKSAEHALQITRAIHVLGPDHDLIRRMKEEESPYIVKTELSKEIPYSASWNKKERAVAKAIVTAKVEQNPEVQEALEATGTKRIVHNVADKFWGTGGKKGSGKNIHGRFLMSLRDKKDYETEAEDNDNDQESEEDDTDWSEVSPTYKYKFGNTPSIFYGDSLSKPIKENQYDNRGTYKIFTPTSAQLIQAVKRSEPNTNVKSVGVHVAINDVMTNSDRVREDRSTVDLKQAFILLHEKFPNAIIGYSEAVYGKSQQEVDDFNHEMEIFINTCGFNAKYIDHENIKEENFRDLETDFKHLDTDY